MRAPSVRSGDPLNILFVMRHAGYVRNFESTLRLLCERGHRVHVAFQAPVRHQLLDAIDIGRQLAAQYPNFSHGQLSIREGGWDLLGRELRLCLDYLRYLTPEYHNAPKLRMRARRDVPEGLLRLLERWPFRSPIGRRLLAAALRGADGAMPRNPEIDAFIQAQRPDLLLVTPLVEPGSPQTEYVRSARGARVRTVFCVASWDNLTNKGLVQEPVDLVTVWNDTMKQEAIALHGVPPARVAVTGAQPFDHWFSWQPSTARAAFCGKVGLRPDRPYFLYVCSSKFVAPDEAPFVEKWARQLRAAPSADLREAGILVRPHPQNVEQWRGVDLGALGNIVVWPPAGAAPIDEASRTDYFDSIYHSAGVVGVNTTAEIESAIIGRQVYTLLAEEFRDTQEGTLHFRHLRQVNGGLVRTAADFPEHVAQLDAALREPVASGTHASANNDGRCRRFVDAFVRPFGIDVAATPKLVAALEGLAAGPVLAPSGPRWWAPAIRRLLASRAARLQKDATVAAKVRAQKVADRERKARQKTAEAEKAARTRQTREMKRTKETSGKSAPAAEPLDVAALIRRFQALKQGDRIRFVREASKSVPDEVWLEMLKGSVDMIDYAAEPSYASASKAERVRVRADVWLRMQRLAAEELDFPDVPILMSVTSKAEKVRIRACAKEPWTIEWLRQSVREDDVLYDIGANVGAYSLVAAKKPDGRARVFAFEASYLNIAALCSNIVLNDLSDRITPLPVALSGTTELDTFNLLEMAPGAARHSMSKEPSQEGPTLYPQPVLCYRLDDLVTQLKLPEPNHIKLDVDGGELGVLQGASRTLSSPSLRSILIEVSTDLSQQVSEAIESHGFRLASKVNVRNKAGQFQVWYGIFVRSGNGAEGGPPVERVADVAER